METKIKVLLVDDDALVRMFLRQILPWETEGYTIIGDARDGEEALQIAAQTMPDLVLADVSMPVMDGVELVRQLREKGCQGGIIMLSCHDDFDYVKNAMQLGADEYLLKNHLTPDSLRQALQSVWEKKRPLVTAAAKAAISVVSSSATLPPSTSETLLKGQRTLRRECLEELMRSGSALADERALLQQAGISGSCRPCAIILARLPSSSSVAVSNFLELCYQLETGTNPGSFWSIAVGSRSCAFLLDLSGEYSTSHQQERVHTVCQRVETSVLGYLQTQAAIGVSGICNGAHAVADALTQAKTALLPAFYDWEPHQCGASNAQLTDGVPAAAQAFLSELPDLLHGETAILRERFTSVLTTFRQAATLPGVVLHWLQNCDLAAGVVRPVSFYAGLNSLVEYESCVDAYVERAQTLAEQEVPRQLSAPIAAAVRYLRRHFREAVTLGDVSEQAGFHPSYFSSVFKQEMGIGFSEYLTNLRLDAVCTALLHTNDTIKKVAADAGFVDYQHFCKTFKKHNGVSPAAFRKQEQD